MGMQDRDYWREWHNEREKGQEQDPLYDPKLFRRDRSGDSGLPDVVGANWPWPYQLAFLTLLVLAIFLVYKLLDRPQSSQQHQPVIAAPQLEKIAADARRKRDAQWQAFYRPSASCKENSATVDCANEFIRARRAFEEKYGQ